MHPILARGQRLVFYLLVFAQSGLLLAEILVRTAGTPRAAAYALVLPPTLIYGFACLASWYLCRHLPLITTAVPRLLAAHALAGALSSGLLYGLVRGWSTVAGQWQSLTAAPAGLAALARTQAALILVFGFLLYSLVAAVHYLSIALEERRQAEARAYELQLSAREAELRALKAQVDPHFLFNSLNAIAALSVPEPRRARGMCLSLAAFLRDSLRHGAAEAIPLREEIALTEKYLAIERQRFGDRLETVIEVDEAAAGEPVPPLLVQPLIENAIKHGIAHLLAGGTVSLRVKRRAQSISIEVENPTEPDRPRPRHGEGIGLANVARRLRAVYGGRARFDTEAVADRFIVRLEVPIRGTAEAGEAAKVASREAGAGSTIQSLAVRTAEPRP